LPIKDDTSEETEVMTAGGVPGTYVTVGPGGWVTKIVLGGAEAIVVSPEGEVV